MPIKEKPKQEIPNIPALNTATIIVSGNAVKIVPRGSNKIQIIQRQ